MESYKGILTYEENGTKKFVVRCLDKDFLGIIKSKELIPYIIPPLAYKDDIVKPLGALWGHAYNALCNFKSKFYIGYSLPNTDVLARVLFSSYRYFANLDRNDDLLKHEVVKVINPDVSMEAHYRQCCCAKFAFWNTSFENFVDVINENKELKKKLSPYAELLLKYGSDKFIQSVAKRIFDHDVYRINSLEKKRLKEYLEEFYNVKLEI